MPSVTDTFAQITKQLQAQANKKKTKKKVKLKGLGKAPAPKLKGLGKKPKVKLKGLGRVSTKEVARKYNVPAAAVQAALDNPAVESVVESSAADNPKAKRIMQAVTDKRTAYSKAQATAVAQQALLGDEDAIAATEKLVNTPADKMSARAQAAAQAAKEALEADVDAADVLPSKSRGGGGGGADEADEDEGDDDDVDISEDEPDDIDVDELADELADDLEDEADEAELEESEDDDEVGAATYRRSARIKLKIPPNFPRPKHGIKFGNLSELLRRMKEIQKVYRIKPRVPK